MQDGREFGWRAFLWSQRPYERCHHEREAPYGKCCLLDYTFLRIVPLHGGVFLGGVLFMDDANPVLGLSVTQRYALGRDSLS